MRFSAPTRSLHTTRRATRHPNDRTVLLVMVVITMLILGFMALLDWRARQPAATLTTTAVIDPSTLLPLAAPVDPLTGGHDMNNLPDSANVHPRTLAADVPQPNVALPLPRWNWGTIPAVPPVMQSFPIQNTGSEPLLISSVVTSCGCTTATLSSSVIPPGQRADLKVVFDPNFHATSGPVTRLVWLQTNDPDQPVIEMRLDANVTP